MRAIEPCDMAGREQFEDKTCSTCGRRIEWRKRWERNWDAIRHCGEKCRRNRPRAVDAELEQAVVELLGARSGTICPSEAARRVRPEDWRAWMERTRQAARRLAARGRIEIRQKGRAVDPSTAKGPIRLARGRGWNARRM